MVDMVKVDQIMKLKESITVGLDSFYELMIEEFSKIDKKSTGEVMSILLSVMSFSSQFNKITTYIERKKDKLTSLLGDNDDSKDKG